MHAIPRSRHGRGRLRAAAVLLAAAALAAQPKPTLPEAKPVFTAGDTTAGIAVRCVDAVSGAVIEDASVVPAGRAPAPLADGSLPLPPGTHWFEATAPGYIARRTRALLTKEQARGTLVIPLFPEFTYVTGRVPDGEGCAVVVAGAAAPDDAWCTGKGACDAQGRFALRVRALPEQVEIQIRVGGRSAATIRPASPKATRATDASGEHRGIAVFDCGTLTFAPTLAQRVFLDKFSRRAAAATAFRQAQSASAAAVDAALAWLVAHQDEAGSWDCDEYMKHDPAGDRCAGPGDPLQDVGVTGLAVLALLARGEYPGGPTAPAVTRAVGWLRAQQEADGRIGLEASVRFLYGHLIATLALGEALAFAEDAALRQSCERAVGYVLAFRHPEHVWGYAPQTGSTTTSVTGLAVHALTTARDVGIAVPDEVLAKAARHLAALTDDDGRTGYNERGGLSSRYKGEHEFRFPADRFEALTGGAMFARAVLRGAGIDAPTPPAATALLARTRPVWKPDAVDEYGWMLAAHAAGQLAADKRAAWQKALADAVLPAQQKAGAAAGSWDPVGVWAGDFGRVGSTALLALALQAPHRYLRLP